MGRKNQNQLGDDNEDGLNTQEETKVNNGSQNSKYIVLKVGALKLACFISNL